MRRLAKCIRCVDVLLAHSNFHTLTQICNANQRRGRPNCPLFSAFGVGQETGLRGNILLILDPSDLVQGIPGFLYVCDLGEFREVQTSQVHLPCS